jgi:hypothetical protein
VPSLLATLRAAALALTSPACVDVAERAQALAGALSGVDLTRNAAHVNPALERPHALERLRAVANVSRDFRAAGAGAEFDRLAKYPPKIYGGNADKSRAQSRGVIAWRNVSTIVLHTAGVDEPTHEDPTATKFVMHPDRWLGVPTHSAVAADATIVLCHELNTYLWAAHTANKFSCSIEIAGNKTITSAQIEAARALLTYHVDELRTQRPRDENGELLPVYIAPHRFYHRSRRNDCGAKIWAEVGEWGMRQLGLKLGPVLGSGKGLPFG